METRAGGLPEPIVSVFLPHYASSISSWVPLPAMAPPPSCNLWLLCGANCRGARTSPN